MGRSVDYVRKYIGRECSVQSSWCLSLSRNEPEVKKCLRLKAGCLALMSILVDPRHK